jgi:hypothetical protein
MVPCLRLYAYLACTLARAFPGADHEYGEWVQTYSAPAFLRLPAAAEALLDAVADSEPHGEAFVDAENASFVVSDFSLPSLCRRARRQQGGALQQFEAGKGGSRDDNIYKT